MLGILLFTVLQTEAKGERWAQMCGNPALCFETKVCVLSVSKPAKRKCLIPDTDQPVRDTSFYNQIYFYFLLSIILWAVLCQCSSFKTSLLLPPLGMKQQLGCLPSLSIRGIIQIKADSKFQELFWPGYSRKLAVFLLGAKWLVSVSLSVLWVLLWEQM